MTVLEWLLHRSSLEYAPGEHTALEYFMATACGLDAVIVDTSYRIEAAEDRVISEVVSLVNKDDVVENTVIDTIDNDTVEEVISESNQCNRGR